MKNGSKISLLKWCFFFTALGAANKGMGAQAINVQCSMLGVLKGGEGETDSGFEHSKAPIKAIVGKPVTSDPVKKFTLTVKLEEVSPSILPQLAPSDLPVEQEAADSSKVDLDSYRVDLTLSRGHSFSMTTWYPGQNSTGALTMNVNGKQVTATCEVKSELQGVVSPELN